LGWELAEADSMIQLRLKNKHYLLALSSFFLAGMPTRAQSPPELNVMPLPAKAQQSSGSLKIDAGFTLAFGGFREARLDRAGQRFLLQLNRQTGIVLGHAPTDAAKATLLVTTDHESKPVQELGEDES